MDDVKKGQERMEDTCEHPNLQIMETSAKIVEPACTKGPGDASGTPFNPLVKSELRWEAGVSARIRRRRGTQRNQTINERQRRKHSIITALLPALDSTRKSHQRASRGLGRGVIL